MSPRPTRSIAGSLGFPRVSGDEPKSRVIDETVKEFSPRERG